MANILGPDLSNSKKQRIAQKKADLSDFAVFSDTVAKRAKAFRELNNANDAEQLRRAQIDQNSLVRNSELGTLTGQTKQVVNRLAQGGLQILSEAVAGANNNEANRLLGKLDDRTLQLAQREFNGESLSPEDNAYLNRQIDTSQFYLPKFGTSAHHTPSSATAREVFAEALSNLKQAGNIDNALTKDTVVAKSFNPLNREAQSADIAKAYEDSGLSNEESLTSNPMALFKFAVDGAKSLINNPASTIEYAAESLAGAASAAVPGLAVINSANYANDVRANNIDRKLQDKNTTLTEADIEEANQEGALAGALDFAGDVVTARAAGILKSARKGKKPKEKTIKRKATEESVKRPLKVAGSSVLESVTEGAQSAIEEDAFGEDFDLKTNGKDVLEAAVIGAGASGVTTGTGQVVQTAKDVTKAAPEVAKTIAESAKAKNQSNDDAEKARKERTEQSVGVANETKDYSDIIEKSTAQVEESEKLDIEEVASTISRQFEAQSKDTTDPDSTEANESIEQLSGLWDATVERLASVMEEIAQDTDTKKPELRQQASELGKAMDVIEAHRDKISEAIARDNNTTEAITNVTNATERNEDFELNAQRILDTDAVSPDSISVEQMEALLRSDKWTPEERTRLENSFNAKQSMKVIEESRDIQSSSPNADLVSNDIFNGRAKGTYNKKDKGAFGVKSYRQKVGHALRTGNIEAANKARDYLAAFADKHTKKSEAIQLALGAYARVGQNGNFTLQYNEQEQAAVDYLAREHKFEMKSGTPRIAPSIQREAEALRNVLTEVDGLIQAKRDVDPISIQSTQPAPTANTSSQATQEQPTATADASPTVTETSTPEATETVSNDTAEQPTTEATQPEAQTTPEENTQTVTEPEDALATFNARMNTLINKVGSDGHRMMVQAGYLEDGSPEEKADARKSLEEYAAKSEAHSELYSLIQDIESGTVSTDSNPTVEQTTESESEAVTDEEVGETNLEQALQESRAEEVRIDNQIEDLRKQLTDKEGITNQVIAELGLADKEAHSVKERTQINEAVRERQGELLTQIQNYKADQKAVRNSTRALEGQKANFDGTAKAFENEGFAKKFVPANKKTLVRAIPNLISQLKRAPSTVLAYAKEFTSLTSNQKGAIKHFTQFAEAFGERLNTIPNLEAIAKNPDFHLYTPLMEDDGFSETAKAGLAAAAYTWLANDAKGTRYTDARVLARRFNISDSDKVPASLVGALAKDGLPINMLYKALGQNAASALGIRLNEESASTRDMSVLQLQLGQMVVATMSDMGLLEVRQRPMADVIQAGNAEVRENVLMQIGLTKAKQENLTPEELDKVIGKIPYTTAIVKHDPTTEPFDDAGLSNEVQEIIGANEDTDYVVEKLFDTHTVDREPSLKPGEGLKEGALMKGTMKQVSERTRAMTAEQEQKAITIVQDNDLIMSMLNVDDNDGEGSELERVLGIESKNRLKAMPKRMRDSAEAKGNGLLNEWNKYQTWRNKLSLMKNGLATPFYLGMEVWNYGRFGYTNQMINPQTSKIHRALVGMKSWKQTVSVTDGPKIQAFLLGVAQGLNVDIDKQTADDSLAELDPIINDSDNVFNKGAVAINELKANGAEWAQTDEGKAAREDVVAAVVKGKHNVHSLHALTNLARYLEANDKGREHFDADIWLEIDGITNGVVIGSIIFGNGTAGNLREELEAGGIFFNEKRDYGEHASTEGNKDFYERQAEIWQQYLQDEIVVAKREPNSIESKRLFAAVRFFTGLDVFSDKALEISRKMAKSPLMQNVYGAGKKSLSNDLADAIIDNLDTYIDKVINGTKGTDEQKVYLVNYMLQNIEPLVTTKKGKTFNVFKGVSRFNTVDEIREADYDAFGLKILQDNISNDFASPMLDAIETHFQAFKFNRAVYIDNMKNQADVFKSLYEMRVKEEKERLVSEGIIDATDEIPEATRKAIADELHHIMPTVENPNGDGTYETDLQAVKVEDVAARTAKGNTYKANFKPNSAVKVQVLQPNGSYAEGSLNTLSSTATVRTFSNNIGPGVGVQNIHGNDAGIIQPVVSNFDIFNVHDGIPAGLNNYKEVGQAANQAFLDNVFNNNPFSYAKDLIDRTVDEINERKERGDISASTAKTLIDKLTNTTTSQFGKDTRDGGNDYEYLTSKAVETSDRLGELRNTVESVQQYYLPGTGVTTELGNKNDEARSNGTYEAPKAPELSKDGATQTASTVQRTKEMQQKNLKENTSDTGLKDTSPFATTLEKALKAGESFSSAFKAAVDTTGSKGFHVSLINKLLDNLPSDFEVQLVHKDSDSKLVEKMKGIRGAHIKGTGKLLLKSTEFNQNSLNLETLAHELLHVVTANTIDAEPDHPAVKKLDELLRELRGKITDSKFLPALENSKELVAWGLTNKDFIKKLRATKVKGRRNGKLLDAFTAFADALKGFFGGKSLKNDSALKQLIELSAAVMEVDSKVNPRSNDANIDLNAQRIQRMSPVELIRGLAAHGQTTDAHTAHLVSIQEEIVNVFAGPMGADLKLEEEALGDDVDQYLTHLSNGTRPFVSAIQTTFNLTPQEAYVAEQLEAVLDSKILDAGFVKNRLVDVWESARKSLTWESFLPSPDFKDDAVEVAKAKAKYDYLFSTKSLNKGDYAFSDLAGKYVDSRASDFLTRFAAASAVSSEVRAVLEGLDEVTAETSGSIWSRVNKAVMDLFGRMEELVNGNFRRGGNLKAKQDQLLNRMAQTNHRNRQKLNLLEKKSLEGKTVLNKYLSKAINSVLTGDFVTSRTESERPFIAAAANVAQLVGTGTVGTMTELLRKQFKKAEEDRPNPLNEAFTEVFGRSHPDMDSIIDLTRKANRDIEQQRQFGKQGMISLLQIKLGKLNDKVSESLHKSLLSTDAGHLLANGYDINRIDEFLTNDVALDNEIKDIESRISGFQHSTTYINQAKALAYYMVTGNATSDVLHKNAHQIVNLFGLNQKVTDDRKADAIKLVDTLTSLYAMTYTSKGHKKAASQVIRENNQKDENGVEFMLKQYEQLRLDALEANFDGEVTQMTKGYTPESVNPHITHDYALPGSAKAESLYKQGYKLIGAVGRDERLDSSKGLLLFAIEDGGMARRVTGTMSFTAGAMKGTEWIDSMEKAEQPITYKDKHKILGGIIGTARKNALARISDPNFDPRSVEVSAGPMMIPTFHNDGSIRTFRYEMSEALRAKSLQKRYNAIEALATMQGNVVDKRNTRERNRAVVDTLVEQYNNDPDKSSADYVHIGPTSDSVYLREYWNLLPFDTQQYIREKTGLKLPIKRELLHATLGFRKPSLSDIFKTDRDAQGMITSLVRKGLENMLKPDQISALIRGIKKGEDGFAVATSIIKDNVVVKNLWTTMFNIVSNFLHLLGNDVPLRQAFSGSVRGYREAAKYNKLRQRAYEVEREIAVLDPTTEQYNKFRNEANKLQTLMATSPVHKLMEAGLFQTIVEDIDNTQDPFSFKSKAARKIDEWSDAKRVGPLNKLGKFLYVTQDTQLYKMMNQPIQMSDFAARFAMFEYLTEMAPEKLDDQTALNTVSEHFVNYDIPTSPQLQWLNDHGLLMFSKYYLRILRPVWSTFAEKPASTILSLMMTLDNALTSPVETVLSSTIFDKITNPISSGLDAWDEPLPLQAVGQVL